MPQPAFSYRPKWVNTAFYLKANLNTQSFPTINYIDASGKAIKYESEDRSVGAMAEFAKSGGKVAA